MSPRNPAPHEADHTELVHVLGAAGRRGLSLQDSDALATFIGSSEYHDAVRRQAVAEFARELLGPRTDDLVITPQVGTYLAEAEKVGGRSTWAMRYADEAHAHHGQAGRFDRLVAALNQAASQPRSTPAGTAPHGAGTPAQAIAPPHPAPVASHLTPDQVEAAEAAAIDVLEDDESEGLATFDLGVKVVRAVLSCLALTSSAHVPVGLCGDRSPHGPHRVEYAAVAAGPMDCHGEQSRRMPWAAEQAQRTAGATP